MISTHGDTVPLPTTQQWEEGPVYVLRRTDWRSHDWSFHGISYNIRFRGGAAEVYGPHFEEWIGDQRAAKMRIEVIKPSKIKAQAQHPVKKKPVAKKKPAAKVRKKKK